LLYKKIWPKDKNISVALYPRNFLHKKNDNIFFLSGIKNSETIVCNENGYYSIYQSDRYGFNNPDNEWDKKEIEYFLVGDSFTHGSCVNRPNDISSVLRNLSNKSILNLGMRGNGPLIEYTTLREYLDNLQLFFRTFVVFILLIRFNPFSNINFTDFDRKLVFTSAVFLISTTGINEVIMSSDHISQNLKNLYSLVI
jgi:hypothetical protein